MDGCYSRYFHCTKKVVVYNVCCNKCLLWFLLSGCIVSLHFYLVYSNIVCIFVLSNKFKQTKYEYDKPTNNRVHPIRHNHKGLIFQVA